MTSHLTNPQTIGFRFPALFLCGTRWAVTISWIDISAVFHFFKQIYTKQRAKKVVFDSPGLVDFAIGLVNSVINLPNGQMKFFEEFKLQKNCEINLLIRTFLGLVEMMFGLVNVSFSLPEWKAVKMTFFAPRQILLVIDAASSGLASGNLRF